MESNIYQVKGMSCDHCKHAVESALQGLHGVKKATVDLGRGEVSVDFSAPVSLSEIAAAIDDAGYELVTK